MTKRILLFSLWAYWLTAVISVGNQIYSFFRMQTGSPAEIIFIMALFIIATMGIFSFSKNQEWGYRLMLFTFSVILPIIESKQFIYHCRFGVEAVFDLGIKLQNGEDFRLGLNLVPAVFMALLIFFKPIARALIKS